MKRWISVLAVVALCRILPAADGGKNVGAMDEAKKTADANNAFAVNLYGKLKAKPGNLFFSPFSISTALAMVYAGAETNTAKQMSAVLHLPADKTASNDGFDALLGVLEHPYKYREVGTEAGKTPKMVSTYSLDVADCLWVQREYKLRESFLRTCREKFRAAVDSADFANAAPAAREVINKWVEEKTHGKIKNIVPKGLPTPLTRVVLANAIYFKAPWNEKFSKNLTASTDFDITAAKSLKVRMMNRTGKYPYYEDDTLQALRLDYKFNQIGMVILLPRERFGLADLESKLTPEYLEKVISGLGGESQRVAVSMPKFKVESSFRLSNALKLLGMTDAFVPGMADFSGMNGNRMLYIQAVLHKAFVEVDEEGTEAAAATVVMMGLKGFEPRPRKPIDFIADHPFIFLIRDNRTGAILFMGRVVEPPLDLESN